ncbi:hypothetical protein AGABI1DRAFT_118488 [Agaricus bisporus var. burnettii JB137-S8]|uniref:Protein kinase domain-containing protein n=1 Tax=Agaricus bisporus var. burnettii (strain JB137-S8 / ATCC MYA-4627 / FGSC 10392) TaxID=597362 RepID=K5W8F8_AGABU|nr:uncharacterized protein AGABI1DRAFT_118488 [Agaricus bisporus var. burnettii JB137-S8]EKM83119.1 hypothetical protein AGABI1DRAFT_118488 [Agaricus bisporus var. burnettii JB137-S8]
MADHGHLSPPPPLFSPWPTSPLSDSSVSVRSSSSLGGLSSSSSLASTFSDFPPPPSAGPKTLAFLASPFSKFDMAESVSSDPTPPRSITADFFATPIRTPSPPRKAKAPSIFNAAHLSRIFPSRYTAYNDDESTGKHFVELDAPAGSSTLPLPSSTNPYRLPTPPPPSPTPPRHLSLPDDEQTPRPTHLEPAYTSSAVPEPPYVDPSPGCVITSNPPCISNPPNPTLTVTPPANNTTFAAAMELNSTTFEMLSQQSESSTSKTQLQLIRPLGQGAFSSVWLAHDKSLIPLTFQLKQSVRELRRKASIASLSGKWEGLYGSNNGSAISLSRKSSLGDKYGKPLERESSLRMRRLKARVRGTTPVGFGTRYVDERHGEMGIKELSPVSDSEHTCTLKKKRNSQKGRLVAVKLTPRKPAVDNTPEEERTRVGFVREVEILKHISHPNITALLEHMSTSSHHILVLPYLPGGDLLGLVNNDIAWSKLGENVLRRIWCELCKAVGWMHGVGLVHRDIKLENILLTTHCFSRLTPSSPCPTLDSLPTPPTPLIKLSDFGLSRFVEVDERTGESELLWTRCGSEAYAAPELVMGTGSVRAQAAHMKRRVSCSSARGGGDSHDEEDNNDDVEATRTTRGFYDARETDAWACGVVLYALVGRRLPFGEGVGAFVGLPEEEEMFKKRIGGDGMFGLNKGGYWYGRRREGSDGMLERRQWLMRIARGEYEWPLGGMGAATTKTFSKEEENTPTMITTTTDDDDDELVGERLVQSKGTKRIVGRLLVRDPRKRARIMDLWDEDWMWGVGGGYAIGMNQVEWKERGRDEDEVYPYQQQQQQQQGDSEVDGLGIEFELGGGEEEADEGSLLCDNKEGEVEEEVEEVVDGEEGWLLDQEGIGSVARQEVV